MDETREVTVADGGGLRTEPILPEGAYTALETTVGTRNGLRRGPASIARSLGVLTSVLVLAVFAAGGFVAGVKVQKRQGGTARVATSGATTGAAARFGAGGAGAGAGGAGAAGATGSSTPGTGATGGAGARAAGGAGAATGGTGATGGQRGNFGGATGAGGAGTATAGQVKLVDGPNIYVTDNQGNVVKVTTSDSSRFTRTGPGTLGDVHPGDTVIVQGAKGADGIVTASAVVDNGAAAGG